MQRRHVDRDRPRCFVPVFGIPCRPLSNGLFENPLSDLVDDLEFFCDMDELCGFEHAPRRVRPPHQRLGADDATGLERDLRLPMQDELLAFDGLAQVAFEQQARRRGLGEVVGEDLDA